MSGPRPNPGRLPLAACLASALLALCGLASCTKPTPGYCDMNTMSSPCGEGMRCDFDAFTCVTIGVDNDAGTDGHADSLQGDAGDDHPVTTDGANDGRDAAGESPVDGPKSCPGGCAADGGTPICDPSSGTCVGCLGDTQCPRGAAHICDTTAKRCVQCLQRSDCTSATAPICANQICRGCLTDAECLGIGPEVCMVDTGGHCATDDETVYVKNDLLTNIVTCSNSRAEAGSSAVPYCESQLAINAALRDPSQPADAGTPDGATAPLKTLVVMRGPDQLANWTLDGGARTLTVVGQSGAWISPGPHDGIALTSGTLYLRNLRVGTAMPGVGIRATGGELHADRLVVDANNRGGVFLDNVSFAINNSVIAGNGQGFVGGTSWSGIFIGTVPDGGPASLINDTIVGNVTGGVVCMDGPPPTPPAPPTLSRTRLSGLVFWGNTPGSDLLGNCSPTSITMPCCGTDNLNQPLNPMLTATWHLMSGSPCIGKLPRNQSTGYDLDGQPRTGTMVDCGADEYVSTIP